MPTIKITHGDPVTGDLTLDDNGNTITTKGSNVIWQIANGSGVSSIQSIYADAGQTDVFQPDPAPAGGSTNWSGRINPVLVTPAHEDYTIVWVDTAGATHTYDPRISVNS